MTTWERGYQAGYKAGLLHAATLPARSQKIIVGEFVRAQPGLRGVEIAKETGMNHASVRIALFRLLADGAIRNEKGRWFTEDGSRRRTAA